MARRRHCAAGYLYAPALGGAFRVPREREWRMRRCHRVDHAVFSILVGSDGGICLYLTLFFDIEFFVPALAQNRPLGL